MVCHVAITVAFPGGIETLLRQWIGTGELLTMTASEQKVAVLDRTQGEAQSALYWYNSDTIAFFGNALCCPLTMSYRTACYLCLLYFHQIKQATEQHSGLNQTEPNQS